MICREGVSRAAAVWLVAAAAVAGQSTPEVTVGFGGRSRAGSWTPVVVAGAADGSTLRVAAPDPDGALVRSPPGRIAESTAHFLIRCGRPAARLLVEDVASGSATAVEAPAPLPSTAHVWLLLGDLPALSRAARLMPRADAARPVVIGGAAAADLTAVTGAARDFDGVDVVVACATALKRLDADAATGIDAWIRDGGRLVLSAGTSARTLAVDGGPVAGWLPGPVTDVVPLRGLAAIETYARASGLGGRPAALGLRVPLLDNRASLGGAVDVFEGNDARDLPLVVRRAHGFGSITWIGLDLDAEPFRGWPGTDTLLVRLLGGQTTGAEEARTGLSSGPPDLAGQLRLALETPGPDGGIAPVSFALVASLGLLYAASMFPLDWWLVTRSGRPWIAWLSLPVLVASFTAAAWGLSARSHSATVGSTQARAAEIVDIDASDGAIRGRSWLALWRRDNTAVDVMIGTAGQGTDAAVSWCADAGPGFGAIDASVAHPTLATADYAYGDTLAGLVAVPVAAVSSRLFEGAWSGTASAPVTSTLERDGQGALRGSVAHALPFTLRDCRLAHGGWLYDVGTLSPGQSYDLARGRGPRSLAGALARRDAVKEREASPRWERSSTDLARILEVAGFHAAAGGASYTGLESGRLERLDLSPLLPLDRAILLGTATDPAPGWTTDWRVADAGQGPQPTACATRLYRIVIPLGSVPPGARDAATSPE